MADFYTKNTRAPVCPYCGAEKVLRCVDDLKPDEGEFSCEECGKEFCYATELEARYYTCTIEEDAKAEERNRKIKEESIQCFLECRRKHRKENGHD